MPITEPTVAQCIAVLEALVQEPTALSEMDVALRNRLLIAAGRVSRPQKSEARLIARALRKKRKQTLRAEDEALLSRSEIRRLRQAPVFVTPSAALSEHCEGPAAPDRSGAAEAEQGEAPAEAQPDRLNKERNCYVCKKPCATVHYFYDQMCAECGDFNFAKRSQRADLRGKVALVTGARVKIGYQAAILLLRSGCEVIVTTRFARDAATRFSQEPDFAAWSERLEVYGLDLRHTPSVEAFAQHLDRTRERLDFIIHNACQTVRRPVGFYAHLMEAERKPPAQLPESVHRVLRTYEALRREHGSGRDPEGMLARSGSAGVVGLFGAAEMSQLVVADEDRQGGAQWFPDGQRDADLQQVDLRARNSWRLALDEVGTTELLEVQLVNAIAPYVLNARLRRLMRRQPTGAQHIVNVSAMEGQFYRRFKTDKHPHTNMAKAALNMMTRTSAPDYLRDGIHMNSVDTGWVTDEDAAPIAARKVAETGFQPPLDIVDGAARIVDPIFSGINTGRHVWGQFLKDYRATCW